MEQKQLSDVLIALDQGTTSTRAMAYSLPALQCLAQHQIQHRTETDDTGKAEHDAEELLCNSLQCCENVLERAGVHSGWSCAALAITNQRETLVIVDKASGRPIGNAIVWNDTRSRYVCEQLEHSLGSKTTRSYTGLPISPYATATKLQWLRENNHSIRSKLADGSVWMFTIEAYLVYKLTGGRSVVTDVTNASRTMLMNIERLEWSEEMCSAFAISRNCLPQMIVSNGENVGTVEEYVKLYRSEDGNSYRHTFLAGVPIMAVIGDQHASLLGHGVADPIGGSVISPDAKVTYGTGAFVLSSTGQEIVHSTNGLLTTVAFKLGRAGRVTYALEGAIASAASALDWCAEQMGLAQSAREMDSRASYSNAPNSTYDASSAHQEPVFVPALTGLLAPRWDADARGALLNVSASTSTSKLCQAVLEGVAMQVADVIDAMERDAAIDKGYARPMVQRLLADGGAANAHTLMQAQADVLKRRIVIPSDTEVTARGAAIAAAYALGYPITAQQAEADAFEAGASDEWRRVKREQWSKAVEMVCEFTH